MTNIALLHPGQMGAAVGAQAVAAGATVRWHPTGRSSATRTRAERAGLEPVADLGDLLATSDLVISLCPPAYAEDLARSVTRHHGTFAFVDANAISPQRCARIAALLPADRFLDATVIGPPPGPKATARLHIAGPTELCDQITKIFAGTALHVNPLSDHPGDASALKMAFASYQKASRALAAVAHALALHHHVEDALLTEANHFNTSPLAEPDYIPTVAARAWRWAPEMLEVADSLRDADLPDDLAQGAAAVLHHWDNNKDQRGLSTEDTLHSLRQA